MKASRWCARMLLTAAFAMVIETACSSSPPPAPKNVTEYEGKGVVMLFHMRSGITFVTSHYAVTDSSVVIQEIRREPQYYIAHPHDDQVLNPPPKEIQPPVELKFDEIKVVEKWEPRSLKQGTTLGTGVIVGVIVLSTAVVVYLLGRGLSDD